MFQDLRNLTSKQRHVILACYLGWTLDAFDFFILVFILKDIAAEFSTTIKAVTMAITLTLAMRPLGALGFGLLADRFGRRPVLMINVLAYSILEFLSGFAPSLTALIVMRALFGIAMGGEWGVGASLALESIPTKLRGLVSGILQTGYSMGYLLASVVFYGLYAYVGWRGMFMVGVIPALLVLYMRRTIAESPSFLLMNEKKPSRSFLKEIKSHWGLFIWAIVMMTCFNFLSHGTQDLYPTFLEQQRGFDVHTVSIIAIIYNIGSILGGLTFGILSNKWGRKKSIITAALLSLLVIPLWIGSKSKAVLACGAFLIQFFVQGAWGVVPAHLNELSPDIIRGVFPGVTYQLGNLFSSYNATLEATVASAHNGDYAFALAIFAALFAILLALVVGFGPEARDKKF